MTGGGIQTLKTQTPLQESVAHYVRTSSIFPDRGRELVSLDFRATPENDDKLVVLPTNQKTFTPENDSKIVVSLSIVPCHPRTLFGDPADVVSLDSRATHENDDKLVVLPTNQKTFTPENDDKLVVLPTSQNNFPFLQGGVKCSA